MLDRIFKNKKNTNPEILKYLGLLTQLGLTTLISATIVITIFFFLDEKLGTNGILSIVGVLLSVVAAYFSGYFQIKKFLNIMEKDEYNRKKSD